MARDLLRMFSLAGLIAWHYCMIGLLWAGYGFGRLFIECWFALRGLLHGARYWARRCVLEAKLLWCYARLLVIGLLLLPFPDDEGL
jgi:hypothetical protein